MQNPFRYFNSSPEVIRLAVMMYVRFPLSPRQVEDLLHERGIDNLWLIVFPAYSVKIPCYSE
jgi:transposase-like protein